MELHLDGFIIKKFVAMRDDARSHERKKKHGKPVCCLVQSLNYRGADKSLARPTSRCILFENISFDASLVIYTNSTNLPPIMIINRLYENQNLLTL